MATGIYPGNLKFQETYVVLKPGAVYVVSDQASPSVKNNKVVVPETEPGQLPFIVKFTRMAVLPDTMGFVMLGEVHNSNLVIKYYSDFRYDIGMDMMGSFIDSDVNKNEMAYAISVTTFLSMTQYNFEKEIDCEHF